MSAPKNAGEKRKRRRYTPMQKREALAYYFTHDENASKTARDLGLPLPTVCLWVKEAAKVGRPGVKPIRLVENMPTIKPPESVDNDIASKAREVVVTRLDYLALNRSLDERDKVDSAVLVIEKLVGMFPQLAALQGDKSSTNKNSSLKDRLLGVVPPTAENAG